MMKTSLKIILGIVVLVIIIAGMGFLIKPANETEITGAVAGVPTTASNCPTGDDLNVLNQCKAWKNSGIKAKELEILTDDSLDVFCDKILEKYPGC